MVDSFRHRYLLDARFLIRGKARAIEVYNVAGYKLLEVAISTQTVSPSIKSDYNPLVRFSLLQINREAAASKWSRAGLAMDPRSRSPPQFPSIFGDRCTPWPIWMKASRLPEVRGVLYDLRNASAFPESDSWQSSIP